uniref:Uncharacterized protein n=1 Tax=Lotharella oceanica TaxID=641309 RepID=A0A7S2TY30_9EUKA|mmetsp:Transcript_34893/g.64594  ORF Transcript_34893/g.64594 Transcript_34893/m.64594 type:complete len:139 (+) Transcript_34893:297-713(+)
MRERIASVNNNFEIAGAIETPCLEQGLSSINECAKHQSSGFFAGRLPTHPPWILLPAGGMALASYGHSQSPSTYRYAHYGGGGGGGNFGYPSYSSYACCPSPAPAPAPPGTVITPMLMPMRTETTTCNARDRRPCTCG